MRIHIDDKEPQEIVEFLHGLGLGQAYVRTYYRGGPREEACLPNEDSLDQALPQLQKRGLVANCHYVQQPSQFVSYCSISRGQAEEGVDGERVSSLDGTFQTVRHRHNRYILYPHGWTVEVLSRGWGDGPLGRRTRGFVRRD
jgi:hypothetical protein